MASRNLPRQEVRARAKQMRNVIIGLLVVIAIAAIGMLADIQSLSTVAILFAAALFGYLIWVGLPIFRS